MQEPLETLAIINNQIIPCKEAERCLNSPSVAGAGALCRDCRLSPIYWGIAIQPPGHKWRPISKKWKHPVLEQEKRNANRRKVLERQQIRRNKDRDRQAIVKSAAQAELRTQKKVIKATRNSGRINKDGDHVLFDRFTLDTKLQSKVENPIVRLSELDKVRNDAERAGREFGALLLRNKNGRGVLVIDERDIGSLN